MNSITSFIAPAIADRRQSPLTELVDYINDNLDLLASGSAEPTFSAQAARLRIRGLRVEADLGPFTLRTIAMHLVAPCAPNRAVAHAARLGITAGDRVVSPDTVFRLQPSPAALVAMDRLCRVLHMLNHLAQRHDETDLWVPVSLGHLLAIEDGHGRFFEELLRRCGLGPGRVVLVLPGSPARPADEARYGSVCANYRECGYRLALDVHRPEVAHAGRRQAFFDWFRIPLRLLPFAAGIARDRPWVVSGASIASAASTIPGVELIELPAPTLPVFVG